VEKILFLAHTEPDGSPAKTVMETLPAALALGGEVVMGMGRNEAGRRDRARNRRPDQE
jgi:hypothetical protein